MPAKKAAKKVAKKAATKATKKVAKKATGTAEPKPAKKTTATVEPKPAKKAAKKTAREIKAGPSTDQIAEAAYLNYRRRVEDGLSGNHESDWLRAEEQLSSKK